jgi:HSP20 family protein
LTGRRTSKKKVKTDNYVHEEIESGSFQRSFRVPTYVKAADIHAELEHGVLTVRIPKEKEKDESNIVKINKK